MSGFEEGINPRIVALSLGAGVQSSVMALLLSREDERLMSQGYRKPDCAIFADTGWEPRNVYEHLDWLETQLTFPVVRVSAGNLREDTEKAQNVTGGQFITIPLYTNKQGKHGKLYRQCTTQYKIIPIIKHLRMMMGATGRPVPKGEIAWQLIGISMDEVVRMKPARDYWIENQWPLIDLRMTRSDCKEWFESEYPGRKLPRSACIICPFHSVSEWRYLKDNAPEDYEEAVTFDQAIRTEAHPIHKSLDGLAYLHRSMRPLSEVVDAAEQDDLRQPSLFSEECEGLCGV